MNNSLAEVRPELVPEWSEKNLPLKPDEITFGSNKKVWWRGACGHEWQTSVKARSNGEKCPICSGARVIAGINDLATLEPLLAKQWSKKNKIKPTEVSIGSHKKVIWRCKKGHEWEAVVKSRTINKTGCPYCSHNKVLAGFNDLATLLPDIAAEWSDRNYPLLPTQVTVFANRKAWWKCKDCGREWNTLISTRSGGSKCPYCSGYIFLKGFNDLQTTHPEIASEWSEKNLPLKPDEVNAKSRKNVWLRCGKCGNEWKAVINDEYGISAHRMTVTKDIVALQEFGMDIVTIHSTQSKYFGASRKFELPEMKLLIDAVESSKFITKKKSETLIEKIHTMTSPGQVAKLKRNNYVVNRIKPDNEQIYYIIDAINDAINAGKQISFQYYDYTGLKKKVLKNKGEVYKLSPYKLIWCGDYYYVLGYSEKQRKVINFRVDRIALRPDILAKDIIPMPDDFDIENFTKEVFFMFSGEKVLVDLRCDNSLMKTMVDRFGEDVTTLAYDMTSFRVQTEVSASPTFFGWVFGFNGKVQILAPESVKEQYKKMLTKATEDMNENE